MYGIELNATKHSSDSVADPHHFDVDPVRACHFDAGANPDASYLSLYCGSGSGSQLPKKAQNLEKVLKQAYIQSILACHLQIDADTDPAITLLGIRIQLQLITLIEWAKATLNEK